MGIDDLKIARKKLKIGDNSQGLPGREEKLNQIEAFLTERLKKRKTATEGKSRAESVANIVGRHDDKVLFLCGVPGTGKTASVDYVIEKLKKKAKASKSTLKSFSHVYVQGHECATPDQIYSNILYKLTNKRTGPGNAQRMLEKIFMSKNDDEMILVVVDELDLLYSERRQNILYNLFDWPTTNQSRLILVTIANAMDISDKLTNRISSRLGFNKMIFEPYTSEHLEAILVARLGRQLLDKCFAKNSILVATRRIGKTTGDARRIIDTVCLALDEAINRKLKQVSSAVVDQVGFQNIEDSKLRYIQNLKPLELLTLKSIYAESDSQGEENIRGDGVYRQLLHHQKSMLMATSLNEQDRLYIRDFLITYDDLSFQLTLLQAEGIIYYDDVKNVMEKRIRIREQNSIFKENVVSQQIHLRYKSS